MTFDQTSPAFDLTAGQGPYRAMLVNTSIDADIDARWARRVEACADATIFAGPVFQAAIRHAFAPDRQARSIAVFREDELVGLLPFDELPLVVGPLRLREVGFSRNAHLLRNNLLIDLESGAVRALLSVWQSDIRADTLLLSDIPERGRLPELVVSTANALGLSVDLPTPGRTLDFADLACPYDAYLATRSGQFRRQIRKRQRELESAGTFTQKRLVGEDLRRSLPLWRAVASRSWQGNDPAAAGGTEADWALHRALADNGALWIASLDDLPVAALRMLEDNRAAYVHTMHFDQSLRDFAPGLALFDAMMRDACNRGVPRVDFNGSSEFFARWATGQTRHVCLRIYRPSLRGRAAQAMRSARRGFAARTGLSQTE